MLGFSQRGPVCAPGRAGLTASGGTMSDEPTDLPDDEEQDDQDQDTDEDLQAG